MIIRSFKKQLLPDKFDLNFIFATNDDAVRNVFFSLNFRINCSDFDEDRKFESIFSENNKKKCFMAEEEQRLEENDFNEDEHEI